MNVVGSNYTSSITGKRGEGRTSIRAKKKASRGRVQKRDQHSFKLKSLLFRRDWPASKQG